MADKTGSLYICSFGHGEYYGSECPTCEDTDVFGSLLKANFLLNRIWEGNHIQIFMDGEDATEDFESMIANALICYTAIGNSINNT